MRADVNARLCAGCGPCQDLCPEVFEVVGDVAIVKADPVPLSAEEACRKAAAECPTNAITLKD